MVNLDPGERARIADILKRWTERELITRDDEGRSIRFRPSLRSIERDTGIAHQRLSEFLRNPEKPGPKVMGDIRAALASAGSEYTFAGARVTYFDAPVMSSDRLQGLVPPSNAAAFRFVVATDDEKYTGFRSSEWIGDLDRIDELADSVPGGRDVIERIVFDTGESF